MVSDGEGWEATQSRSRLPHIINNTSWAGANNNDIAPLTRPTGWRGPSLPPIIHIPSSSQRARTPLQSESRGPSSLRSSLSEESTPKKAKIERSDGISNHLSTYPRLYAPYSAHRESLISSSSAFMQHEGERYAGDYHHSTSANSPILCSRCKRSATTDQANNLYSSETASNRIGSSSNETSELILVAQTAAAELTKILNTLNLGLFFVRRGCNHATDLPHQEIPDQSPVDNTELREHLDAILLKTRRVKELTTELLQQVKNSDSEYEAHDQMWQGHTSHDNERRQSRKRHLDALSDDNEDVPAESAELLTDARSFTRQRELLMMSNQDNLPSSRPRQLQHSYQATPDERDRQPSIMNPPPAPQRPQPSSPGRSLPSPTYGNYPQSPSAASYASSSSQLITLPGPASLGAPHTSYLPSIASSYSSSDSALQAHTAALQHEVSVQKIALSSLQGEHDKLLAALSRSQTRASALEKKHSVSDTEIITLTEEKLRLQNQVQELEKDVEDLTQSRDEARRSAVAEASQYVDIVKRATQLEKIAAEERKAWDQLKGEMEEKIRALTSTSRTSGDSMRHRTQSGLEDYDEDKMDVFKDDAGDGSAQTRPHKQHDGEQTRHLKAEIERLRLRCAQVEETLREVRAESQSVEGIVRLLETTRRSIQEKADSALNTSSSID